MNTAPRSIFRAYDIRGEVDIDFNERLVFQLGKAIGTYFREHGETRAVLGRDCRLSSPLYADSLADGIRRCGVSVISLGLVPTPLLYFAVQYFHARAGVMVTASHNPPQYNGFKVWFGKGTLHSDELASIGHIMRRGHFPSGSGIVSSHDIRPAYFADVSQKSRRLDGGDPIRVVLDGGNGAGGLIAAAALRQAGVEVIELYCEPDGNFPNHHPDPVVDANMTALKHAVLKEKAHCGIGLDGDADRLGVVDETGTLVPCDRILAIFAREMLARHSASLVCADVKCSRLLFEDIAQHGGQAVMTPTGHSFVKEYMRQTGALLGGELTGHFYFADRYYGFDDGIYAALRLVEVLSSHPKRPLSTWLEDWPASWTTPEIRIPCPESEKFTLIKKAREHFQDKSFKMVEIDGIRLEFPDGFALLRASNTQPELTLRFESGTAQGLQSLCAYMESALRQWLPAMPSGILTRDV